MQLTKVNTIVKMNYQKIQIAFNDFDLEKFKGIAKHFKVLYKIDIENGVYKGFITIDLPNDLIKLAKFSNHLGQSGIIINFRKY